jgi:hypothetical protein
MTTTIQFAFPWPCGNTFKPSLEMNHALTDADLQRLTGGYRSNQKTCEEAIAHPHLDGSGALAVALSVMAEPCNNGPTSKIAGSSLCPG